MKFTTITLLFLLLFSCTKQEDPIINFTVTQNWWGQIVLTANLEKITPKNVSVVGFSAGMSSNHYIQENQVKTDQISSNVVQLTMNSSNFVAGQTYYFSCFLGTKSGKLIRSAPVAFSTEIDAPCNITNNTFLVNGSGSTGAIDFGTTNCMGNDGKNRRINTR